MNDLLEELDVLDAKEVLHPMASVETGPIRIAGDKSLREILPEDFHAQIRDRLPGYLLQEEWRLDTEPFGRFRLQAPVLYIRAVYPYFVAMTEAVLKDAQAAFKRVLEQQLPESAVVCVKPISFDKWNNCWLLDAFIGTGDRTLLESEEEDDFDKDSFGLEMTEEFAEPEDLSADGERAYKAIIAVLQSEGVLNSGGSKVFYSPAQWKARGEEFGLNSELIVVHDGGDHAPYFNLDYQDYLAHAKMDLALKKASLYAETQTTWYSAIFKWSDAAHHDEIDRLEKWIVNKEAAKGQHTVVENDDEPGLHKEVTENPTLNRAIECLSAEGLTLDTEPVRINPDTFAIEGSIEAIAYPNPSEEMSSAARRVADRLKSEFGGISSYSSWYDLYRGAWVYRFIVPWKEIAEGEEEDADPKDLNEPADKVSRIHQLFATHGFHIEHMTEMPADPEPGWGEMGKPRSVIDSYIQPNGNLPWTMNALATEELADFLRRVMSDLAEILETTDVDYTSKFNGDLGAWKIRWVIGDMDKPLAESDENDDLAKEVEPDDGLIAEDLDSDIAQAAKDVDRYPTDAEKEAGNYEKGHVIIQGLDISIENPKGSFRSGVDKDGKPWSVKMPSHYGYIVSYR